MRDEAHGAYWRFVAADASIGPDEVRRICFLDPEQSAVLWDELFGPGAGHLMLARIPGARVATFHLGFDDPAAGRVAFDQNLGPARTLLFAWGRAHACLVPREVFLAAWDDFFYPSDESSVVVALGADRLVCSFERTFFVHAL